MLDKIFKEGGQQIAGPVFYEALIKRLENDPWLSQFMELEQIARRFSSLDTAANIIVRKWRPLLGIRIIDTERLTYIGVSVNEYTHSKKSFFGISRDFQFRKDRLINNELTANGIQCVNVKDPKKDSSYHNLFRTPVDNIIFEFVPISKFCKEKNEEILDYFVSKTYEDYLETLSDPPNDTLKKFFPEVYSKEDKEHFLNYYNSSNPQGILDYMLSRQSTNPHFNKLKQLVNEKRE